MCLVTTGYESGYTCYKILAVVLSGFLFLSVVMTAEIFSCGWLLGVSDVADWCKVHSALKLEVVTNQIVCIIN